MCHATMSGNKRSKSITESGFELVLNYSDELINKEISLSYQRKKKERKKLLPFLLKTVNFISYLPLYCKHKGEFFNIVLSKNRQLCPDSGQEQRDILFHFYTTAVQSLFTPYGNMDIFLWPALVTGLTTCSSYHSKMAPVSERSQQGGLLLSLGCTGPKNQSCRQVKSKEVLSAAAVKELGQKKKIITTHLITHSGLRQRNTKAETECNDIKGDSRYVFSKTNRHSKQPFSLPPTPSPPSVTNGGSNFVIRWL